MLNKIENLLIEKYDFPVFELEIIQKTIKGFVLLDAQLKLIQDFLRERNSTFELKISVLSDENYKTPFGYGKSLRPVSNVFSKPIDDIKKISPRGINRLRNTQVLNSDPPFKILFDRNNYYLIKVFDGTLGWIHNEDVIFTDPEKIKIGKTGFLETLKSYLNVPYLWGGTSYLGIDCSGLVQRVFFESKGIILPKNSHDQAKKTVDISKPENQDLVFAESREKGTHHVGIFFADKIYHSCLVDKKVVSWNMKKFRQYYEILNFARVK